MNICSFSALDKLGRNRCRAAARPPVPATAKPAKGLFLEDEAAANRRFFVAATDTVEHLRMKEEVDGRPAQPEKSKRLQTHRCRNGDC
jgi:hypothetical protein